MRNRNDSLFFNGEGYYDPTAGQALLNVLRQQRRRYVSWSGQPIYLCTDSSTCTSEDLRLLDRFCNFAILQGAHPVAPILFYSDLYDLRDRSQRSMVLKATRSWFRHASEIWILGKNNPFGLKQELQHVIRRGKTVRRFAETKSGHFYQTQCISTHMRGGT